MTAAAVETTPGFRHGDRHGAIDRICTHLEMVLLGQAAAELLDSGDIPTTAALLLLPIWTWVTPGACVGRKGRTRDGQGSLLLPARTTYDRGPLVLLAEDEQASITWSYIGSGQASSSTIRAVAVSHTCLDVYEDHHTGSLPELVQATLLTRRQIIKRLTALVEAGKAARWQLYVSLERDVRRAVESAHNSVVAEINDVSVDTWGEVQVKLDDEHLAQLTTEMTYGADGKGLHDSRVSRMIEKLITPGTLNKVDPLMYLSVNLKRDAEMAIRGRLGDTWIGPKIRRVVRSMPGATMDEIFAAYNARYPADRLGPKRLYDALTIPASATVSEAFDAEAASHQHPMLDDHADEVITRIDLVRAVARRNNVPHVETHTVLPLPTPMLEPEMSTPVSETV